MPYALKADAGPNEVWIVVVFHREQAYVANAGSPEQHQRYREMMQYPATKPERRGGKVLSPRAHALSPMDPTPRR